MGFEMLRVLFVSLGFTKQHVGEQPFADQKPLLAQFVVDLHIDLVGEMEVQVKAFHFVAVRFQQGRKRPQLNGRVHVKAKRHVD
jgi:hypothetical protein